MSAMQSALLYEVVDTLRKACIVDLAQIERQGSLREASTYRTLSKPDVVEVADVISVAFLAKECKVMSKCNCL